MLDQTTRDERASSQAVLPVPRSQPERLFVVGSVHGLTPKDAASARVLELHCGSGQNLLALAERYPESTWVGVDPNPRFVAMARQSAAELELTNVAFHHVASALDQFDYILASEVFSYQDEGGQEKLLQTCATHLAPAGLAYVSYNTYPGWSLQEMLLRMMRFDAEGGRTPHERISRARLLLDFLSTSMTNSENLYEAAVQANLGHLVEQTDAQLRHESLERRNQPVYFRQFIAQARSHGLQLVGDCTLGVRGSDFLDPDLELQLDRITTDPVQKEQYRDVVRNRSLRQSVLCRQDLQIERAPKAEVLKGLFIEAPIGCEAEEANLKSTDPDSFMTRSGVRLSTGAPLVKAALVHLGAIWPNYIAYVDLLEAARQRVQAVSRRTITDEDVVRLQESLLECGLKGIIELHSQPQSFTTEVSARPLASPVARWQARREDIITNRSFEAVRLELLDREVIGLLDGTRETPQIVEELAARARSGRLMVSEQSQRIEDDERMVAAINFIVPQSLERLARHAFLIA